MDYKLELAKLLKHCIEEANKRKNATAPLDRGVRMGYQNIRFAIDEIFERAQAEADTYENNALLPDVSTRTCTYCQYRIARNNLPLHEQHQCLRSREIIFIADPDKHTCEYFK